MIGDLELQNYTVQAIVPDVTHTEIRCPACIPLGYPISRLVFIVYGEMVAFETPVQIEFHCRRCRSVVKWSYGTTDFEIVEPGERNHKRQKVAFE